MFLAVAGLMTFSAMAQTEEVVADSVATEEVAAPAEEVAPVQEVALHHDKQV